MLNVWCQQYFPYIAIKIKNAFFAFFISKIFKSRFSDFLQFSKTIWIGTENPVVLPPVDFHFWDIAFFQKILKIWTGIKIWSFCHQQIFDSSFRLWDIALRTFCDEYEWTDEELGILAGWVQFKEQDKEELEVQWWTQFNLI